MDASASPKVGLDFNGYFVQIENSTFSPSLRQNNTVIKYTKLPDFDYGPKVPWIRPKYTLPRLRRFITIDVENSESRSLKNDLGIPFNFLSSTPFKINSASFTKRKIVTIDEDEEKKFPQCTKEMSISPKSYKTHKAVEANISRREPTQRATTRLSPASKYSKIQENSAKTSVRNSSRELLKSKPNFRGKNSKNISVTANNAVIAPAFVHRGLKTSNVKDNETTTKTLQEPNTISKLSVSKQISPTREGERKCNLNKFKHTDTLTSYASPKKPIVLETTTKTLQEPSTISKLSVSKHISTTTESEKKLNLNKFKPTDTLTSYAIPKKPIILDITTKTLQEPSTVSKLSVSKHISTTRESERKCNLNKFKHTDILTSYATPKNPIEISQFNKTKSQQKNKDKIKNIKIYRKTAINNPYTVYVPIEVGHKRTRKISESGAAISLSQFKDAVTTVDCSSDTITSSNDMNVGTDPEPEILNKLTEMKALELKTVCTQGSQIEIDILRERFDNLDIPNFTLIKEKSEIPKDDIVHISQSSPNVKVPALNPPHESKQNYSEKKICKSTSYIIGHATLTYTTRQKINIHVVGNNNDTAPNLSSSPLAYPMNIVSVLKKEIKNKEMNNVAALGNTQKEKDVSEAPYSNCLNEIKSLNWSCVFDSSKLVKPSEIISTIRVNNGLLQSDYICEQFQRELNFIDSFFESLQYLESCSLTDKCFTDDKVENWVSSSGFNVKNPEYDSFFSKLENGAISDDSETMASKSLCLLNLLIRDEQRRAKNLLFVLKMREDALKDFTKSQILWLENKKKQENTDISTLKKKQRGALLKLQHECGEMQRMRKALLALSEKRKVALMKTKKNIELKLKNNVTVDQIILGKKLKRNTASDRSIAPLKCFDLSSSGCDESATSRPRAEPAAAEGAVSLTSTGSLEKCIQTGDSLLGTTCVEHSTDTAAENCVGVDGGYLNILFHNLSLPQIFSSGKQYEVNEEALRNIVNSSNSRNNRTNESDAMDKLIEQIKSSDADSSSSPSTARSLVEELDQYYKDLAEEEKTAVASPEQSPEVNVSHVDEHCLMEQDLRILPTVADVSETTNNKLSVEQSCEWGEGDEEEAPGRPAGPLPIPAGESADSDDYAATPLFPPISSSSSITFSSCIESTTSQSVCSNVSISSLVSPGHGEAEELRRQQLAIEREIKALEQQQCQLLVVREIPDKPPPPYTPPNEIRTLRPPPLFLPDDSIEQKIVNVIVHKNKSTAASIPEAFDVFITDFCQEMVQKQKCEESNRPWDACNLLPQKTNSVVNKLVSKTSSELKNILTGVTPTVVSGVGARRSDHIDDILFAEWRRCEPEWTALHTDEAGVKNQIFDSIFQKILTETVDEYKKTVLSNQLTG